MSTDQTKAFGDYELEWDSTIENDGQEFVILPDGDYEFEVLKFERARHNGSEKMPPCHKAVLDIQLTGGAQTTTVKHNLFLHSSTEWRLCEFFVGIGQRKHGERMVMNWGAVPGAKGRCKVTTRSWTNDKGETRQSNQIQKFYEPDEKQGGQQKYQAGKF